MSFSVSFSVVFLGGVLYGLLRHFSRNGCHLGAFWQTFGHVLEVCGVLLGGTHSEAKTTIFMFWRSRVGTSSSTFPGLDSLCVFYQFSLIFCDLGAIWASLLAPFGLSFRVGFAWCSG